MTTFSVAIDHEFSERSGTTHCSATFSTQMRSQVGVFRKNFMATKCLIKFLSQNHEFSQISESFLSIDERYTHVMLSKIRYDRLHRFRHPSFKGDSKSARKTLLCIVQSVMSGFTKTEDLCSGICTTIP